MYNRVIYVAGYVALFEMFYMYIQDDVYEFFTRFAFDPTDGRC